MSSNQRSGKSFSEAGRIGWEKTREIHKKSHQLRVEVYNNSPSRCVGCQNSLPYDKRMNKFCGHTCSARYSNTHRILEKTIHTKTMGCYKCGKDVVVHIRSIRIACDDCRKRPSLKTRKTCKCGREFDGFPLQETCPVCEPNPLCLDCGKELKVGRVYCTLNCQQNYKYKTFIERWQLGQEDGNTGKYKEQISRFIERWLKEKSNGICSICHGVEWQGKPIPLLVDHMDGDSRNTTPENLRMICGNCDMQTLTYKGRNKGKGRFYRRERYGNGQSY